MWTNWDLMGEMEALHRQIHRAFDRHDYPKYSRCAFLPGRSARQFPLVNLWEDKDSLYVEALAPGLDTETLDVTVQGNQLVISGEKKPLEDVRREAFHRSERAAGKFRRKVRLNAEIEEDKVRAVYEDGILNITLPKAERAKKRLISVDVK